ncbi:MAG TPA: ABC transporter permease [Blastocatellia bacterium]|nr:ABC transporter permease [Blastocatellia bacterium]
MGPERWPYKMSLRFRSLFRRKNVEQELNEELQFHIEQQIQNYTDKGLSSKEAHYMAMRSMGGVEQQKEKCRSMRRVNHIENLFKDISFSFRILRKNPGFTFVAIITLALGIGSNSAVFSVLNSVVLKPLPFKDPSRIVNIGEINPKADDTYPVFAPANYVDFEKQQNAFESVAAINTGGVTYTSNGENEDWDVLRVTEGYFQTLGVPPLAGRIFAAGDMPQNAPGTAILSYRLWQRKFGGDTGIIGKTITLGRRPTTIIGIMPEYFRAPLGTDFGDLWMPLSTDGPGWDERDARYVRVFGRLKAGITQARAQSEMDILASHFAELYPASNKGWSIKLSDVMEYVTGDVRPALLILFAAGCCVLLVASANVANLLLARANARKRELGIRAALGASRARLIRQVLVESVMLTLIGGALGAVLTALAIKTLQQLRPVHLPRVDELNLDWRVLLFALGASIVAGCFCGAISGWLSTRVDVGMALNDGGSRTSGGLRQARARSILIVAEISLSLMLLVSAGLLMHSFYRLTRQDPGFDSHNVFTAGIGAVGNSAEERGQFFQRLIERINTIPGIESASLATRPPLLYSGTVVFPISIKGQSTGNAASDRIMTTVDSATPDYFRTLRIPIKAGRGITEQDRIGARGVCVVNESLARRYFGSTEKALGHEIDITYLGGVISQEIVGVAGNVKRLSLTEVTEDPAIYLPEFQVPWFGGEIVARTKTNPAEYTKAIQQAVRDAGSDQNLYLPRPMDEAISRSVAQPRFYSELFGVFAGIAVVLACVGLYGVISYATGQRTQEIGIRVALGAKKIDIIRMIVGQGMILVIVGVILGIVGALGATKFLETLLYGVTTTDILSYFSVSLLLVIVAMFACYIPARRATKVDPITALRYE